MNSSSKSIVVYGEALIDDFGDQQVVGGAPFNVARNLAAFRLAPMMITRIGQDQNGMRVRAEYSRFAMSASGLQWDLLKTTGRVVVERGADEHRFIILPDQAYDQIDSAAALSALAAARPATIYFGTMAQRNACSRATLDALLAASDARRYLDLNLRDGQVDEHCVYSSLHQADIVKVNELELQQLLRWFAHPGANTQAIGSAAAAAACGALLQRFTLEGIIVTLGEHGSAYFGADGTIIHNGQGLAPTRVVDTVGAGDAFSAVFLLGRALGWPLGLTLARANAFAGAMCGVRGAVPADLTFYQPWIAGWLADAAPAQAAA
jgi:fructokinase